MYLCHSHTHFSFGLHSYNHHSMDLYDITIPAFQHRSSSMSVRQYLCRLVPGDVLLATAFLSYSGPFNQEFRNLLLSDWQRELKQRHIPFGDKLNLTELLIDAPTVSEWNLQVSDLFLKLLPTTSSVVGQKRLCEAAILMDFLWRLYITVAWLYWLLNY